MLLQPKTTFVFSYFKVIYGCLCEKSLQSCPTLWDPIDCSLPGSSVHGILQGRTLEWVAIPSPGDLPDPGIKPMSPASPALREDSLPLSLLGSPLILLR